MTISTNLVPSLLQALVHADGDALVLHVSDRPHVVAAGQRIDLGTRELPVDIVHQLVEQLFPAAAQTALKESGAMAYVLPEFPPFAGEHFTVVATGGDDLRVVIQRRRRETEPLVGAPTSHGRPADMSGARGVSDLPRRAMRFPPVVLLIEDSSDQTDLYEVALRDVYQVRLAASGEAGVQLAIADPPDLALIDLNLPGMDGWETCRRLKAHPRTATLPLIILTSRKDEGLGVEAVRVGASDLLMKPCSFDMLRDRIRAVLDRSTLYAPD